MDRVLTSMHVYVALAVFAGLASRSSEACGADEHKLSEHAAQCTTRAAWLHAETQRHLGILSESGRRFVAWVGAKIDDLDRHLDQRFSNDEQRVVDAWTISEPLVGASGETPALKQEAMSPDR